MIFKTFNNDIDKWTAKIGIFGKSFNELGTAVNNAFKETIDNIDNFDDNVGFWESLKNNLFSKKDSDKDWIKNSLGEIISKENIDSYINELDLESAKNKLKEIFDWQEDIKNGETTWNEYFDTCKGGNEYVVDLIKNTDDLSKLEGQDLVNACNSAREAALAHNAALKQQTLGAKAAAAAIKGFSIVANTLASIGLSIVASKVISFLYDMVTANEQFLNSARELSEEFNQEQASIDGYKNKIEELQNTIKDSSSSFDDVTQARKDLMAIQDELIKKFGTEKDTIEIITDAINNQSDALDSLTKKQYQQWKNEFNDKSFGEEASDFFASNNISGAINKLTELDFSGAWDTLTTPIESNIDKMIDCMQYAYYEIEKTGNDTLDSLIAKTYDLQDTGSNFVLHGNLNDVYEDLLGIQEMSKDFNVSDRFESDITRVANVIDHKLNSLKDSYDIFVLYEKILDDAENNQYDDQFNLINKAKEAYDDALVSDNEDKIKEASEKYAQTLQSAIDLAMTNSDFDVADYFKSMYPELRQMFGEWQFNINFEPNTDGLKDKVANALDTIDGTSDGATSFSVEDIENFNPNVATQEQIDAYGELTNVAESYGLTIKQLITLLQTMGLIQSESYQQLVDTFGQKNVDKLSPEDLEIAYTIKNVGDITFDELTAKIEKLKSETLNPATDILSFTDIQSKVQSLQQGFDQLDSIYADIVEGGDFDWSSILNNDGFKEAFGNMQNVTEQYKNTYDDFIRTVSNSPSDIDACQDAFNNLATAYIQNSGILEELTEETRDATVAQLEQMGISNAAAVVDQQLALEKEKVALASSELANMTWQEISALLKTEEAGSVAQQAMAQLALEKIAVNNTTINTSADIDNIISLANAAGASALALAKLQQAKAILGSTSNGTSAWLHQYEQAQQTVKDIESGNFDFQYKILDANNFKFTGGAKTAKAYENAQKGAGKATKDTTDALKEQKEALEKQKEALEDSKKELEDLYDAVQWFYDNQIDGIDRHIDKLNEANEALEKQKDNYDDILSVIYNVYDDEIDALQAKIDAMDKANDAAEKEIALEKAKQALIEAQNRRAIKVKYMPLFTVM